MPTIRGVEPTVDVTLVEKGTRAIEELDARIEKAERTKNKSVKRLDILTDALKNQVGKLVRALFNTDRNLTKALKKLEDVRLKAAKEGKPAPDVLNIPGKEKFAGVNFALEQIDPKAVIEQRELTVAEQRAVADIVNSVTQIEMAATEILALLTSEIYILESFRKVVDAVERELKNIMQRSPSARGKQAAEEFSGVRQRTAKATHTEQELRELRRRAIKVQKMSKQVRRIGKGVGTRRDAQELLFMVGGAGALLALAGGLVFGSTAAGVLALPALLAFAASKTLQVVKRLKGE